MKRLITLLLAMVMALSLVVPAWAGDATLTDTTPNNKTTQDVTVNVTGYAEVYSVTVSWESLNFTYKRGAWQPGSHTYASTGDGIGWNDTSATVTVTNDSNASIWYTAELVAGATLGTVSVNLNSDENELTSDELTAYPVDGKW